MTQQTLEGKTDCRRQTKGTIRIEMTPAAKEKFPEICEDIREVKRKYPCVKISVNGKKIGGSP